MPFPLSCGSLCLSLSPIRRIRAIKCLSPFRHTHRRKLLLSGESLLERLTLWVSAFVERAATESSKVPQQTWLARIEREIGNIRVALDWSTTSEGHVGAAARILGRLAMFWHDAGKRGEGQRWIDRILPQMDEGAEPLLTGRLWRRATAVNGVGSRAVSSSEKAIALLERAADRKDLSPSISHLRICPIPSCETPRCGRSRKAGDKVVLRRSSSEEVANMRTLLQLAR